MKKLLAIVLALVMVLGLFVACGNNDTNNNNENNENNVPASVQTIKEGKLIMSTNAAFPPYEMTTDDGGFEGIDIEIATEIAKKLNLELEVLDMDFDAALLAVNEGKSDIVMAGVTVNEDRKLVMDFTDSYATGKQVVIVMEGSSVTMDNLGEQIIGAQRGTTGYIYASDTPENGGYGEDHVIGYNNGATAIRALINGQVDCVIIDNAPAQAFVDANPELDLLEGDWVIENYAIGCDKGNTQLVEAINGALKELIEDGTVQKIIDKYITAE